MSGNLFATIAGRVGEEAAPFIVQPDGARFSYGDMLAWSARYANVLAQNGVERGDRVAVQAEKRVECLWIYLACLRLGAVYLPLNIAYTAEEIAYFVGDAEPRLFICEASRQGELAPVVEGAGARILALGDEPTPFQREAAAASDACGIEAVADGDLAAILYTSGTTGRSKGAMISHENLRSNALALVDAWRFTREDVLLHALPIFHTHGLFVATNTILLSGGSMIFLRKFDEAAVMAALPQASAMMGIPTFYTRMTGWPGVTRELLRDFRVFISGSAPLSAEAHRRFEATTGHAILERYGMTETNMLTSNPYEGERRPGSVGGELPGVTVRIAHPETGAALPNGEVGVIEVSGPNVFQGYWRMPEKTAAEFRPDGYFITGDLGTIDEGGYVSIVGRSKDLIISGGYNVYPAEVENALDALAPIAESAVVGLPHGDLGEAVTAIVVPRPGASIDEAAIQSDLSRSLARFKLPKRVVVLDALPRNTMGKIQKNVLRQTYGGLYG